MKAKHDSGSLTISSVRYSGNFHPMKFNTETISRWYGLPEIASGLFNLIYVVV